MSPNEQALLIVIGLFIVVIVLPVIYYMKTHTEEQRKTDMKAVPQFMNVMIGVAILVSVLNFIKGQNGVTFPVAIFSGAFIVASPWIIKSYSKRYGQSRSNLIYIILIDILALSDIIFYLVKRNG